MAGQAPPLATRLTLANGVQQLHSVDGHQLIDGSTSGGALLPHPWRRRARLRDGGGSRGRGGGGQWGRGDAPPCASRWRLRSARPTFFLVLLCILPWGWHHAKDDGRHRLLWHDVCHWAQLPVVLLPSLAAASIATVLGVAKPAANLPRAVRREGVHARQAGDGVRLGQQAHGL